MILKISIFLYIVQTITSKLVVINDKNDLKKELKSHANILILFYDNERASTVIFKLLTDISVRATTIAKFISIDCKANKKLCKHYKVDTNSFVIQHFHKGKFNKVYDRKLKSESLMRFLEDPTGDIPWEEDETGKDIVHAKSAKDLQKLVESYKTNIPPLMLMFYAPWCGHCKKMKPEFGAAASSMKTRAIFVGINGDVATTDDLKQAFNVTGYPSVFLVQEGKNIYKFENDNSKEALIKFVDNPTQPTKPKDIPWPEETQEIDFLTDANFDDFVRQHESVLVMFYAPWCGHCKTMKPEVIEAVQQLKKSAAPGRIAALDSTEHRNISELFNISGFPTLKYFREGQFQFDVTERTASGLVKFMLDPKKPKEPEIQLAWNLEESAVLHPSAQDFTSTTKRFKHSLVMFYAPWCGHCKKSKPGFTAAANEMKGNNKVAYVAVDCTESDNVELCKSEKVEGFPTLRYYNYGKTTPYSQYSLEREQDDFVAFMKDPVNPKLDARRHWRNIPGNEAIVVLETDTFVENIVSQSNGALVMFYAPWCGHCNAMKPAYVAAAQALKSLLPSCILGTVDATSEPKLASQYNVKGYPTLIYFSSSGDWTKYSGERTEEDIKEFMLKKDGDARHAEEENVRMREEKEQEEIKENERRRQKEIERQEIEEKERRENERKREEERKQQEDKEKERKESERKEEESKREEERERVKLEKERKERERKEEERKREEEREREKLEKERKEERKREEEREREKLEKERKEERKREEERERVKLEKERKERERQEEERKREEEREREKLEKERKEREELERKLKESEEMDINKGRGSDEEEVALGEGRDKGKSVDVGDRKGEEERVQSRENGGMVKVDTGADFEARVRSAGACLVYFHKSDKKSHVRKKVAKFLQRHPHVVCLDVDCGPLVQLCDEAGLSQLPAVCAYKDGRLVDTLGDVWTEDQLEQLAGATLRVEL